MARKRERERGRVQYAVHKGCVSTGSTRSNRVNISLRVSLVKLVLFRAIRAVTLLTQARASHAVVSLCDRVITCCRCALVPDLFIPEGDHEHYLALRQEERRCPGVASTCAHIHRSAQPETVPLLLYHTTNLKDRVRMCTVINMQLFFSKQAFKRFYCCYNFDFDYFRIPEV